MKRKKVSSAVLVHTQDGNFGKIPGGQGTALARDESIMAASFHALQSARPIITLQGHVKAHTHRCRRI